MHLTRAAYAFIGLIVLLGIAGQWSGEQWHDLWQVPAAMLLVALGVEHYVAHRPLFTVAQRVPSRVVLGERFTGELLWTSAVSVPLRFEVQKVFPNGLEGSDEIGHVEVPPCATAVQSYGATAQQLGKLLWPSVYARVLGRFGLAWWPCSISLAGTLHVVPARLRNKERAPGVQEGGDLTKTFAGAGNELHMFRDYRPGDPLRSIDWKATARSGRYTVRVFAEEQHLELMVLLDAGRLSGLQAGALTRLNHYVNCAARLAEKAAITGDRVGAIVFADKPLDVVPPVRGAMGLIHVRRALERARPVPQDANPLTAVLLARRLLQRRSLIVLFTDLDENEEASQLVKAAHFLTPKHLPLIAGIVDEDVVALQQQRASQWLDPYYGFAAVETLQAMRGAALRLQRLGAFVVLANPPQLDGAVLRYYQDLRSRKRI